MIRDELEDVGAELDDDSVTVYHRTTEDAADRIRETGMMTGKEDGLFFSTLEHGQAEGYGEGVVVLKIPLDRLELDDIFDDEAHLRMPVRTGRAINMRQYLVEDGDPLYHVTYFANLDGIAEQGLVAGAGHSIGGDGLAAHKAGRLFLTETEGIGFWMGRAEEWAEHNSDNPVEDWLVPVVLRVKAPADDDLEDDEIGTRDAGGRSAYHTEAAIDPDHVQVFDGEHWIPIYDFEDIDITAAADEDGVLFDRSPLRPNPAAIPPMPDRWWNKKPPAEDKMVYKTKTDALNKFLDYNWNVVEQWGGPNRKDLPTEYEAINHKYDLKGKRAITTLAQAVWWSMPGPKPWRLENIDVNLLNETMPGIHAQRETGVGFRLPDFAEEQLMAEAEADWWRGQGAEPRRWKCAYPHEEDVPF